MLDHLYYICNVLYIILYIILLTDQSRHCHKSYISQRSKDLRKKIIFSYFIALWDKNIMSWLCFLYWILLESRMYKSTASCKPLALLSCGKILYHTISSRQYLRVPLPSVITNNKESHTNSLN